MQHAFAVKPERFLAHGDVTGIAAAEELLDHLFDARGDTLAQRLADLNVLARHSERHGCLRLKNRQSTASFVQVATASLSLRRCTDDGIRMASRYLATVRRAM